MWRKIKYFINQLIKRLKFIWFDFKHYGCRLGRKGKKSMTASFAGDIKKFPVYLKRRLKNKNLNSRRSLHFNARAT